MWYHRGRAALCGACLACPLIARTHMLLHADRWPPARLFAWQSRGCRSWRTRSASSRLRAALAPLRPAAAAACTPPLASSHPSRGPSKGVRSSSSSSSVMRRPGSSRCRAWVQCRCGPATACWCPLRARWFRLPAGCSSQAVHLASSDKRSWGGLRAAHCRCSLLHWNARRPSSSVLLPLRYCLCCCPCCCRAVQGAVAARWRVPRTHQGICFSPFTCAPYCSSARHNHTKLDWVS